MKTRAFCKMPRQFAKCLTRQAFCKMPRQFANCLTHQAFCKLPRHFTKCLTRQAFCKMPGSGFSYIPPFLLTTGVDHKRSTVTDPTTHFTYVVGTCDTFHGHEYRVLRNCCGMLYLCPEMYCIVVASVFSSTSLTSYQRPHGLSPRHLVKLK